MARVYIDFERYHDKIIEIGALCTYENKVITSFHRFVVQDHSQLYEYTSQARHCHCIDATTLDFLGYGEQICQDNFLLWLKSLNFETITIVGHGDDVSKENLQKWLPQLQNLTHLSYVQIKLPNWIERKYEPYHQSTYIMKSVSQLEKCSYSNHSLTLKPSYCFYYNATKVAKFVYGFHCALFDCYELAFYEKSIPLYDSDNQFHDVFCFDLLPYIKQTL